VSLHSCSTCQNC